MQKKQKHLFNNPDDDKKLQRYFDDSVSDFKNPIDLDIAWDIIEGYKSIVPAWDISIAYNLVDLASLELQKRDYIKNAGKINGRMRRQDAEGISRLFNAIDNLKKSIGIDPKNIGAKGEGSMSETFLELCSRIKFQSRRFVCKPIFGYNDGRKGRKAIIEEFEDADDDALDNFLQKAEMK